MQFGITEGTLGEITQILAKINDIDQAPEVFATFDRIAKIRSQVELGFQGIEIGADTQLLLADPWSADQVAGLNALRDELGIFYTCHLPLWSNEPASPYPGVRKGSVRDVVESIEKIEQLQPRMYVLHATGALASEFTRKTRGMSRQQQRSILDVFQEHARQSMEEILTSSGLASRRLAIETVEFPFELTLQLAEELDLSICFDTGHVLVGFSGNVDFFESLEQALPRLGEVHLHDGIDPRPEFNVVYGTDHKQLGTGDLETERVLTTLRDAAYDGPIVFELPSEKAVASVELIREIDSTFLEPVARPAQSPVAGTNPGKNSR